MNNLKKEISSGAFTLRFILAFIVVSLISGVLFNIIQAPIQLLFPLSSIVNTANSSNIYFVIISILLIAQEAFVGFFATKLALINVTVKKEDALKAKRNMKIFLGIIVFLAVITILSLALVSIVPMIQRQSYNYPTVDMEYSLIPMAIVIVGSIISLVVLIKTCRKTFDRIVFGDGAPKKNQEDNNQINQEAPVQNNTTSEQTQTNNNQ